MNMITEAKILLEYAELDPRRLLLDWVSAAEGTRFAQIVNSFVEQIRELGPLKTAGNAEELELVLKSARAAAESDSLRLVAGKQTELTTNGNKYGEVFTQHEMKRALASVASDEISTNKILLLLEAGPLSVRQLAAKAKLSPPRVLRYIVGLKHKGLVRLHKIEGTSPLYSTQMGEAS
jgi:hypothetical protein